MIMKITSATLLKWMILVVISVGLGTFVCNNILGKIGINIWVARGGGALIAAITALVLYAALRLKRTKKDQTS